GSASCLAARRPWRAPGCATSWAGATWSWTRPSRQRTTASGRWRRHQQAKDYGERSLAAAEEAGEDRWQLHALVLISQAEVKAGRLSSSLTTFERAFELSMLLKDTEAQAAINRAIDDVNEKIVMREREGGDDSEDTAQSTDRTSQQ
ncbi:hypothetical protein EGW08_011596, partial [Elysia chlorotica]